MQKNFTQQLSVTANKYYHIKSIKPHRFKEQLSMWSVTMNLPGYKSIMIVKLKLTYIYRSWNIKIAKLLVKTQNNIVDMNKNEVEILAMIVAFVHAIFPSADNCQ